MNGIAVKINNTTRQYEIYYFGFQHKDKLKELEEKTGYSKVYFFLAFCGLFSGILTLLGGAKLIVDLVGFVYPAYMSFKSMDANNGEDTQWLTYWVVFAFFSIVEGMAGFLTRLIPFYFLTKAGFILWLYHPQTMGALSIYSGVIRPYMLPYLDINGTGTKKSE
jgi:receptor expression-enhancing protein 5/6